MLLRHGSFSYLPDLTDDEIAAQVRYALVHGWPISIEYTDDPHPRNIYWEMWGLPLFDLDEPDAVMCRDQRLPGDVPAALRPRACLRRVAGTADDRPPVPRPASGRRARLGPDAVPRAPTVARRTQCTPMRPTGRPGARYTP